MLKKYVFIVMLSLVFSVVFADAQNVNDPLNQKGVSFLIQKRDNEYVYSVVFSQKYLKKLYNHDSQFKGVVFFPRVEFFILDVLFGDDQEQIGMFHNSQYEILSSSFKVSNNLSLEEAYISYDKTSGFLASESFQGVYRIKKLPHAYVPILESDEFVGKVVFAIDSIVNDPKKQKSIRFTFKRVVELDN